MPQTAREKLTCPGDVFTLWTLTWAAEEQISLQWWLSLYIISHSVLTSKMVVHYHHTAIEGKCTMQILNCTCFCIRFLKCYQTSGYATNVYVPWRAKADKAATGTDAILTEKQSIKNIKQSLWLLHLSQTVLLVNVNLKNWLIVKTLNYIKLEISRQHPKRNTPRSLNSSK